MLFQINFLFDYFILQIIQKYKIGRYKSDCRYPLGMDNIFYVISIFSISIQTLPMQVFLSTQIFTHQFSLIRLKWQYSQFVSSSTLPSLTFLKPKINEVSNILDSVSNQCNYLLAETLFYQYNNSITHVFQVPSYLPKIYTWV